MGDFLTGVPPQGYANIVIDGRPYPLSNWFLTEAETGERKTSVDREALRPIREFEQEQFQTYEAELRQYRDSQEAYEAARKKALKGKDRHAIESALAAVGNAPPDPPMQPILTTEDITLEGLFKHLLYGWPTMGIFSSEAGRLLGGHAFAEENLVKSLAGLSETWDGGRVSRMRAGDGTSLLLGRRVSMHLMAQPIVMCALLGNQIARDQGFLSRCLVAYPESTRGTRLYKEVNLTEDSRMRCYGAHVLAILRTPLPLGPGPGGQQLIPRSLSLAPDTKRLWIQYADHTERLNAPGGDLDPIRGFASKAAEHAARLAGVFTMITDPDASAVSATTMDAAITLIAWYVFETLRMADTMGDSEELVLAERLLDWMKAQGGTVRLPDVYQLGPRPIRDAKTARRTLGVLETHGLAERVPDERPETWRVCPDGVSQVSTSG